MKKGKTVFEVAGFDIKGEVPVFKKGGEISQIDTERNRIEGIVEKKEPLKKKVDNSKGAFIGKMFKMRDITHLLHLKSKSYAEHKALNGFYDSLLDYTDSVAEKIQSNGLLDIRIPASVLDTTAIDYISSFRDDVQKFKDNCMMDDVKADLDEVVGLCNATLYKLKFLK